MQQKPRNSLFSGRIWVNYKENNYIIFIKIYCFFSEIFALILINAIWKLISIKAIVIIIRGINIDISIEGEDILLILAFWCRVFHQSTENLIIGKFIEPTIIKIAEILSPKFELENEVVDILKNKKYIPPKITHIFPEKVFINYLLEKLKLSNYKPKYNH